MDQDLYHKVLQHQDQLERLGHTLERCKYALLDVAILLESLKKSNRDLVNIAAKTTKDAKPYNQRKHKNAKPSNQIQMKQKEAKPNNQAKQYTSSNSTCHSSTSARKIDTDDLDNNFKKVFIQNRLLVRHPQKKYKN